MKPLLASTLKIVRELVPFRLIMLREYLKYKLDRDESPLIRSEVEAIPNENLERHFTRISFEISNTCNYTSMHDKCPVSCYVKSVTLDPNLIYKTVDELAEYDYAGYIAFHRYNEPMINKKRLFDYIEYTRKVLPSAKITILTNGSYLFEEEISRFESLGIHSLSVSAYSKDEYYRLKRLKTSLTYSVFYSFLDSRRHIYDRKPIDLKKPCFATIRDITVNCYGQISLCCYDWKNQVTFGSLKEQSIKEILNTEPFMKAHRELTTGIRNFDICRKCSTCR